jgi:hypothetical protein
MPDETLTCRGLWGFAAAMNSVGSESLVELSISWDVVHLQNLSNPSFANFFWAIFPVRREAHLVHRVGIRGGLINSC